MLGWCKALTDNGTYIVIGGAKQAMLHALGGPIRSIGSNKTMSFIVFAQIKDRGLDYIKEQAENGKLTSSIDKVYPAAEVPAAIRYMVKTHAQGKVGLRIEF